MEKSRQQFEDNNERFNGNEPDERYYLAHKRVKKIKGFYVHLIVYILVNAFFVFGDFYSDYHKDINFWSWVNFNRIGFWGIGLVAHGISVFGKDWFLGTNWEERKIQELMDKEKAKENKWE